MIEGGGGLVEEVGHTELVGYFTIEGVSHFEGFGFGSSGGFTGVPVEEVFEPQADFDRHVGSCCIAHRPASDPEDQELYRLVKVFPAETVQVRVGYSGFFSSDCCFSLSLKTDKKSGTCLSVGYACA